MIKVDFHTHSIASPDGGITPTQYESVLESGLLDCIAVTDHNRIDLALELHKKHGNKIIVGEEIMTSEGEIIGLFLKEPITPHMPAVATAKAIKQQGGIVYIPHPFETVRRGLNVETLNELVALVDIVEVHNGRAVFQNKGPQAAVWTKLHHKLRAASSDAHGLKGLGGNHTVVEKIPTAENFAKVLATGHLMTKRPPLITLLYPKANRLRNRIRRRSIQG